MDNTSLSPAASNSLGGTRNGRASRLARRLDGFQVFLRVFCILTKLLDETVRRIRGSVETTLTSIARFHRLSRAALRPGKAIDAVGLTTNQKVRVHYTKVGGDNVADKVTLIGN